MKQCDATVRKLGCGLLFPASAAEQPLSETAAGFRLVRPAACAARNSANRSEVRSESRYAEHRLVEVLDESEALLASWLVGYEVFVCEAFALHVLDDVFHSIYRV